MKTLVNSSTPEVIHKRDHKCLRVGVFLIGTCWLFFSVGCQQQDPAKPTSSWNPKVEWNAKWEIRRDRPGYPLLKNAEHFEVSKASKLNGAYHHHPLLVKVDELYLAYWSNHPTGEDGPGQQIIGASSNDGQTWIPLGPLFEPCDEIRDSDERGRSLLPGPMINIEGQKFLVSIVNASVGFGRFDAPVNGEPESSVRTEQFPKRIRRPQGYLLREIKLSVKGTNSESPESPKSPIGLGPRFWLGKNRSKPFPGLDKFKVPTELSSRVLSQLTAQLESIGESCAWDFNSPMSEIKAADGSLLCEPSQVDFGNQRLGRFYRDLTGSQAIYFQHRSADADWSPATKTPIPDAPSKSVVGKLPGGQFFLIGNQVVSKRGTRRDPLTIGLSANGTVFDSAFAIRWRAPKFRVPSQQVSPDGRGRGFQYPAFLVDGDNLWVIYSVNKEAIDVTRIPINELLEFPSE